MHRQLKWWLCRTARERDVKWELTNILVMKLEWMNDLWKYLLLFYFISGGRRWLVMCGASHVWLCFEIRLCWVLPPETVIYRITIQ